MEGQPEISYPKKRILKIFPILLTITHLQISKAESTYPPFNTPLLTGEKAKTVLSIPIFANTFSTYETLKSAKAPASAVSETVQSQANTAATQAAELIATSETSQKVEALPIKTALNEFLLTPKTTMADISPALMLVENIKPANKTFVFKELVETEKRKLVVNFAQSYLDWGIKYRYGGTDIEKGLDCSAFTRYVLTYFDIQTPRTSREQFTIGTKISINEAKSGDLVFFGDGRSDIDHVAMVVSNGEEGLVIVHCCTSSGIKQEKVNESSYWKPKLRDYAVSVIK